MAESQRKEVCSGCGQSFGSRQELKEHQKTCSAMQGMGEGQSSGQGQTGGGKVRGASGQTPE